MSPMLMEAPARQSSRKSLGRAIVYGRVSSVTDKREASLETQCDEGTALGLELGYEVEASDVFTERYTGMDSSHDRPNLNEIRRRIREGGYRAFICQRTDRLARSPEELIAIVSEFRKYSCRVIFVKQPMDDTPGGKLLLFVLGWASENEWAVIADRTKMGFDKLKAAGLWHGKGRVRYGYVWNKKDRTRLRDPETAAIVVRIFRLAAHEGYSLKDIAVTLNAEGIPSPEVYRAILRGAAPKAHRWTVSVIGEILREPTYKGYRVEGRTVRLDEKKGSRYLRAKVPRENFECVKDERVAALIDDDTWDAARAAMSNKLWRAAETRNEKIPFLFRGLVVCGGCGRTLRAAANSRNPEKSKYVCPSWVQAWMDDREADCPSLSLRRHILEPLAWSLVEQVILAPGVIEAEVDRVLSDDSGSLIESELDSTRKAIRDANGRVKNLTESLSRAANATVLDAMTSALNMAGEEVSRLESHAGKLTARLRPFREKTKTAGRIKQVADEARRRIGSPDGLSFDARRELMLWLGVKVVLNHDKTILVRIETGSPEMAAMDGITASTEGIVDSSSSWTQGTNNILVTIDPASHGIVFQPEVESPEPVAFFAAPAPWVASA